MEEAGVSQALTSFPEMAVCGSKQNKAITNHNTITSLPIFADSACLIIVLHRSLDGFMEACKQNSSNIIFRCDFLLAFSSHIFSHPRQAQRNSENQHFKLLINNCGVDFNKSKKAILFRSRFSLFCLWGLSGNGVTRSFIYNLHSKWLKFILQYIFKESNERHIETRHLIVIFHLSSLDSFFAFCVYLHFYSINI